MKFHHLLRSSNAEINAADRLMEGSETLDALADRNFLLTRLR